MTVPCRTNPDLYLQPGEDNLWHLRSETRFAQAQCRNACERLQKCAEDALSIGTCEGQQQNRVADGIIAGGIICRGDSATYFQLHQIAHPGTEPAPYVAEAGACSECERTFIADDITPKLGENTAHRATLTHLLCRGCYSRQKRAGTLTPAVRTLFPSHCRGICGRPLRRRSQPADPDGLTVIHESGGLCAACVRAAKRAKKEAA